MHRRRRAAAARVVAARALPRARAPRQSPGRPRRARQRRRVRVRPRAVLAPAGRTCCARTRAAFGHRLLMDVVVPGGVARDLAFEHVHAMHDEADRIAREDRDGCATSTTSTPDCRIAFARAAVSTPELATKLGLLGLAGRASGQSRDLRCDFPCAPYDVLGVRIAADERGDVAARVAVRFDEAFESRVSSRSITAALLDPAASGDVRGGLGELPADRLAHRVRRGLARARAGRAGKRAGRHDPPLPSAGPVVVELAGDRARGDRQHRPRFSADQQIVQPVVQRARPLAMYQTLRQIIRVGIKTEAAPAPADEDVVVQRLQQRHPAHARTRVDDPSRRRRIVQRLRARGHALSIRTTTSRGSASGSSRARAMPMCCS